MEYAARSNRWKIPAVAAPFLICGAMVAVASVAHAAGGPSGLALLPDYVVGTSAVVVTSILIFVFVEVAKMAAVRADKPLIRVMRLLRERAHLMVLPALVFPVFLAAFTTAKSAMQPLVGFRYDSILAQIDGLIFGTDPWRVTHALVGSSGAPIIEFIYAPVWIAALTYSKALIPLFAERKTVWVYFTAMLLTWFLGGFVVAYTLSSAGPTFANLADAEAAARFLPLKQHLMVVLPQDSVFVSGPAYLQAGISEGEAWYGGGISAMPSMHVAAATLYVLVTRNTRWFKLAIAFVAIIFFGSVYSGYHYVIDGVTAIMIAYGCWRMAERIHAN